MLSKFNGTSTPKGSYRAKTGDNNCNVNSSHYSLSTALCESIRYQAKSEQNVRQDLIPRVRYGEAALGTPDMLETVGRNLHVSNKGQRYKASLLDVLRWYCAVEAPAWQTLFPSTSVFQKFILFSAGGSSTQCTWKLVL